MDSAFLMQNKIKKTHKLSELDKMNIAKEYTKGENTYQIALKYNVTPSSISRVLKTKGIKSRPQDVVQRRLSINENAFEDLSNEDTAYWLGFLLADGIIYRRKYINLVALALQKRDKEHLEKFKTFLNVNEVITPPDMIALNI